MGNGVGRTSTKIGTVVGVYDVNIHSNFGSNVLVDFRSTGARSKLLFPVDFTHTLLENHTTEVQVTMVIYLDYNIKRLQLIKELLVIVIRAQPVILTIALSITESNRVSQKTLRTHALSSVTERAGDAMLWTI